MYVCIIDIFFFLNEFLFDFMEYLMIFKVNIVNNLF